MKIFRDLSQELETLLYNKYKNINIKVIILTYPRTYIRILIGYGECEFCCVITVVNGYYELYVGKRELSVFATIDNLYLKRPLQKLELFSALLTLTKQKYS